MIPSPNCYNLIKEFEGCRLTAYADPATGGDPWTVGYGSTKGVHRGMVITQEEADKRLINDVANSANFINQKLTSDLTQNEFDAICSFVFNCGAGNFAGSTLLRKINAGDMEGAALEFEKWTHADGKVMAGLIKRRHAEAVLFLNKLA